MTLVDAIHEAMFDLETEDDLETALLDWSQLSPVERSYTAAQLRWIGNARISELTDAVRALHTQIEDIATRPSPPDILDVTDAEVIDG